LPRWLENSWATRKWRWIWFNRLIITLIIWAIYSQIKLKIMC
jgi:hypothetical protein